MKKAFKLITNEIVQARTTGSLWGFKIGDILREEAYWADNEEDIIWTNDEVEVVGFIDDVFEKSLLAKIEHGQIVSYNKKESKDLRFIKQNINLKSMIYKKGYAVIDNHDHVFATFDSEKSADEVIAAMNNNKYFKCEEFKSYPKCEECGGDVASIYSIDENVNLCQCDQCKQVVIVNK